MKNKIICRIAALAITMYSSTAVHAALIDNGSLTTDTITGLSWLDLSETSHMPYADVYNATQAGGAFDGYRVATTSELEALFSNYHLDTDLFYLWAFVSDSISFAYFDDPGLDEIASGTANAAAITIYSTATLYADTNSIYDSSQPISTALVSTVPLPAPLYLLGIGLLALTGVAMRNS